MANIYEKYTDDTIEYWFAHDDLEMQLGDHNCHMEMYRDEHYYDRFLVEDPRDLKHWQWFRADTDEETFDQMEDIAIAVGHFLLQSCAPQPVKDGFDAIPRHQIQDDELNQLLGEGNGSAPTA